MRDEVKIIGKSIMLGPDGYKVKLFVRLRREGRVVQIEDTAPLGSTAQELQEKLNQLERMAYADLQQG